MDATLEPAEDVRPEAAAPQPRQLGALRLPAPAPPTSA
jgi:hypothetical protein